jgi:hypothetical protein
MIISSQLTEISRKGLPRYRLVKATAVILVVTFLVSVLSFYFRCFPIEKIWNLEKYPNPGKGMSIIMYITVYSTNRDRLIDADSLRNLFYILLRR